MSFSERHRDDDLFTLATETRRHRDDYFFKAATETRRHRESNER
jgi:hypothetical protein